MKAYIIALTFLTAAVLTWIIMTSNNDSQLASNPIITINETESSEIEENRTDESNSVSSRPISITDGVKHNVPLEDVISGGPAMDGIPSIDNPKFLSISKADEYLNSDEIGLAYSQNGIHKFYPFNILVWHEIVNDAIDGQRILVTYCPLCRSAVVFDPIVQGKRVEFGTSGNLWNSNLVMYDRKTESYWSQILGESIVGEMTGTKLKLLTSDIVKYADWKSVHQDGQILSQDTGHDRDYQRDPYGSYYTNAGLFFQVDNLDTRLFSKEMVLGIVINDQAKAYSIEAVKKIGELEDSFQGKSLLIKHNADLDTVQIFEKTADNNLKRINAIPNFWFSWAASYQNTELYK